MSYLLDLGGSPGSGKAEKRCIGLEGVGEYNIKSGCFTEFFQLRMLQNPVNSAI